MARRSGTPETTELVGDRNDIAAKFGVTTKTVSRWQKAAGLYTPTPNYGRKLDSAKAKEIRARHSKGEPMKDLALAFGVTVSAVSRVVHGITHREDTATVSVTYNP